MEVTVFGGSGFIGSHVADCLTKDSHKVTIFDLKPSPYLLSNQEMVIGNILDREAVTKAVSSCDIVYNFAGIADIEEAYQKPLETVENNILGTTNILESCRKSKVSRFVFASTIYVHSEAGSFYRSSKQACELVIEDYSKAFGLPYTILRFGSVYGSRSDERNYIYRILKQAITGGKITSFGRGSDLRAYIHVRDAARYCVDILSKEFENQHVVITGNCSIRRDELLDVIKGILGDTIEVGFSTTDSELHYSVTPYSYKPRTAKVYRGNYHINLRSGLLECVREIYQR